MKLRELLPPSDDTPGAPSYTNQSELTTSSRVVPESCDTAGVPSPVCTKAWTWSWSLAGSKGKEEPIQLGASSTADAAGRKCWAPAIRLRGSNPDLSSRFTPETFLRSGIAARQRRFEISVYLPLDGLPSQAIRALSTLGN